MTSWQALTLNGYLRLTMKGNGNRPFDVRQLREAATGATRMLASPPSGYDLREFNTDGGLRFALVSPNAVRERASDAGPACVVLYLHGGGYIFGSPLTHRAAMIATAEAFGAPVYALDYRLAPEHPFPAAVEDAANAYDWLLSEHPHAPLVLVGDSAGAGLAVVTALGARRRHQRPPTALVGFSIYCDLAVTGASIESNAERCVMFRPEGVRQAAAMYLAGADARDPRASPLYDDLTGLPPMLLFASRDELLLDDTVRLAERARTAGVRVRVVLRDQLPHAWPIFVALLPEGREAFASVTEFAGQFGSAARRD